MRLRTKVDGRKMDEIEVKEGLALHLDPAVLEAGGSTFTVDPPFRVQGDH